jgi:hypothetical protein
MMPADIVTLCQSANVREDGTLSVVGAFDTIVAERFPHIVRPCTLACRIRISAEPSAVHELKLTILDSDGRILAQAKVAIQILPRPARKTMSASIAFPTMGIKLTHDGAHAIDLILDDLPPLRTPFFVELRGQESDVSFGKR